MYIMCFIVQYLIILFLSSRMRESVMLIFSVAQLGFNNTVNTKDQVQTFDPGLNMHLGLL